MPGGNPLSGHQTGRRPRDLYRAQVRIDDNKELVSIKGIKNVTNSPAGDDYQVVASKSRAAVATRALGQVRSLIILDFAGQPLSADEEWTPLTKFLARTTDLLQTGRLEGIDRTTVRFTHPPEHAENPVFQPGID